MKIRKIAFRNHPVLQNLKLDFCNGDMVANTIIFAGDNGVGKSTIINEIYNILTYEADFECIVEIEYNNNIEELTYYRNEATNLIYIKNKQDFDAFQKSSLVHKKYEFKGIFSDVDIKFNSEKISNVSSMNLDNIKNSKKSNSQLTRQVKQLLIDIQALDDADLANQYRESVRNGKDTSELNSDKRMSRFKRAFNFMFDSLEYSKIENISDSKVILFRKNGKEVPLDNLSSGEKQIIYRGCFLLQDQKSLNGAIVFIDEPEISLHPNWQIKILDYYKKIFINEDGKQTSQLFTVTHSPFIIHNNNRYDDKVIVLRRNDEGNIEVLDRPEYYKCDSIEVVEDAFNISFTNTNNNVVFLEGRTDEKYFNKAIEVFGYKDIPFEFKWIGHLDENDKEVNTGESALSKAFQYLITHNTGGKKVLLFDCDTNKEEIDDNDVYIRTITKFNNKKYINKGIENALILDDIDLSSYYSTKKKYGDYGEENTIKSFEKMKLCNYICGENNLNLNVIFDNLKHEIDKLINIFK